MRVRHGDRDLAADGARVPGRRSVAARALGLALPSGLVLRADRVVE
jgi:hypothetical protein